MNFCLIVEAIIDEVCSDLRGIVVYPLCLP